MKTGLLIVKKTKKGKIFVQIDRLNGKPPMPLSYVSFDNTNFNEKECTYETDKKGVFTSISINGKVVWSKQSTPHKQHINQKAGGKTNKPQQEFIDSFHLPSTLLPKDIRTLQDTLEDIDNFSLKFNKAARYELNHRGDNYKFWFFKNDYRTNSKFAIAANYGHIDFEAIIKRQNEVVEKSYQNNNRIFKSKLNWRMVIGLGGESVYETGMTLHSVYGIPYIPSSSVKGILRSWVISQLFDNSEIKAITESKVFCTLFGCPKEIMDKNKRKHKSALKNANRGILRFFDAFPDKAPKVKTDIMNVHYKDWYKESGYQPPTDTQMPNPIPFLTIENDNDLAFNFSLAATENPQIKSFEEVIEPYINPHKLKPESSILDIAKSWLTSALTDHGIGAKTAVGYGYMEKA